MVNQWDNAQLLYSRGLQLKKSGSNPFKLQFLGIDAVNCIFLDKYTSIICSLGTIFTHQWEWYRIVRCILQQSMKHTGVGVVKSTPPTGCIIWNFWVYNDINTWSIKQVPIHFSKTELIFIDKVFIRMGLMGMGNSARFYTVKWKGWGVTWNLDVMWTQLKWSFVIRRYHD